MGKFITLFLAVLTLWACKSGADPKSPTVGDRASSPTEAQWQHVTAQDGSEPVARHEAAFVGVGNKFYLLGGRGVRPVSIYDTQTKVWSKGPEPPVELHHFQPVVYGSKIYIMGALTGGWPDETPLGHIYLYDTERNAWSQGDAIPEDRQRGSTGNILFGDKIYLVCGIKNGHIGDHKDWVDSYDLRSGSWEILSDAPRTRDHFQAVEANGMIYALAGRNTGSSDTPFGGTIAEIDAYDIATDTWKTLPNPIPTQRAGTAAILHEDEILVAGGESPVQEKAHAEVEGLDLESGAWRSLPRLNEGRHGTGLVEYEGDIYVASGCGNRGGTPELTTMEKLNP